MVWVLIGFIIVVFLGLSRQNSPIEKTKLKDIPKALELGVETLAEYSKKLEQASASLLVKTYQNANQRNIKNNRPLDTLDQLIDRTDLPIKDTAYIIGVNLLNQESSLSKNVLEQKHEALLAYISDLAEEDVLTNLELKKSLRNVITPIPTDEKNIKNIELATQERAQILAEQLAKLAEHNGRLAEEKAKPDAEKTIQEPLHPSVVVPNKIIDFLYVRYYMTGLLTFPNISCVSTNLQNIHQPTLSPEAAWKTLIQQCHFDEKKKKDIRALFHFTHLSNLESIHQHGLLTRTHLNNNKMPYTYNDEIRLDSVPNSISLSIGFPNYRMFYHYWNKSKNHKNDWIILKINPNLLTGEIANLEDFDYLNKAIFCSSNAANKLIRHIPIEKRKTYNAFLSMFESDTECNTSHPCDEQAEILYQGNIPIECIECIYVFSVKMKTYCQTKTSIPVYIDTRLFTYRNTRVMYG